MRFCPLLGVADCREDCLLRIAGKVPEGTLRAGIPNVFPDTWDTPQAGCGLLVMLSAAAESSWRLAGEDAANLQRAMETARNVGFAKFAELFNKDSRTSREEVGPSPVHAALQLEADCPSKFRPSSVRASLGAEDEET